MGTEALRLRISCKIPAAQEAGQEASPEAAKTTCAASPQIKKGPQFNVLANLELLPRLSRMDAAVDAMGLLGFPEGKVKKHVKELLKVYGGDDGWPFIEEYSYKELIDAILRDVEENDEEQVAEDGNQSKQCSLHSLPVDIARQIELKKFECQNELTSKKSLIEKSCEDEQAAETFSRVSETQENDRPKGNAPADIAGSSSGIQNDQSLNTSLLAEGDGKGWKDILPDQTSGRINETASTHVVSKNEQDSKIHDRPSKSPIRASPSLDCIPSPQPNNSRSPQRRLPCYGWIESDEDEEADDFVFLKPASAVARAKAALPPEISKSPSDGTKSRRKRRSRWDQRPDDP
ncbi:hypothetical protein DH2020_010391 [Rehmannia glutinosa]|uniref:WIYLD domain-containing protein n=1 Tax=Rehmannia glutinosa TaxID=99300 RepID=A0ABR0XAI8_REHGL